ncbi:MAG: YfcE family phosphodiesterase [Clostridia bacterium]|nr:YfcE family phosphodiesterase [Clostridia bacterium]MBR5798019.1 YfcE family phosphodiesterase [Clostridia bacterium]
MDILVISDTHGKRYAIERVFSQLNFRPSTVLFLGDGLRDLSVITGNDRYADVSVFAVAGNCDGSIIFPSDEPEVRTVILGNKRVVMMHGHTFDVKWGLGEAICYAAKQNADVLFYGHTHAPHEKALQAGERLRDGTVLQKPLLVANPGSLGEPHYGQAASFGVLTIRDGQMLFSHGTLND